MENVLSNLPHLEGDSKGYVPALPSIYDDFETMQYMRQPLKPIANEFSILINVALLEPQEVEIDVLDGNKIEIHVKHPLKRNLDGLWMTRDASYTYEVPPESCNKVFQAQWFADNCLLVKTNSSEVGEKKSVDRARLVIELVDLRLKPNIEISVLKEFLESMRKGAQDVLHYLKLAVHDAPNSVEKNRQDMVDKKLGKTSMVDSGLTSKDDSSVEQIGESCSAEKN